MFFFSGFDRLLGYVFNWLFFFDVSKVFKGFLFFVSLVCFAFLRFFLGFSRFLGYFLFAWLFSEFCLRCFKGF